jgi:thymidylate synthase (FAD)
MNEATAPKLLRYLMDNRHWSPFEMVHIVMEINTTRDIARQMLRHRSFSFQEFSQRYANANQLGFELRECRMQDAKNRQASIETTDNELAELWTEKQVAALRAATEAYDWAISNGIAKEQARATLPEGITHSRLYMAGTLRSWLHYCAERMGMGTQKEHREIATDAAAIITQEFPSITELLKV